MLGRELTRCVPERDTVEPDDGALGGDPFGFSLFVEFDGTAAMTMSSTLVGIRERLIELQLAYSLSSDGKGSVRLGERCLYYFIIAGTSLRYVYCPSNYLSPLDI
jgi:hypothetical protein